MGRSSLREATLSPPPPSVRSSVTSRRSSAMLPLTSSRRCPPLLPPPPLRSPMSFPTVRSLPLETRDSDAPRLSSSHPSLVWRPAVSMRLPITPSCPEAPPCTPVLLTECRRRSPLLPHPPSRSRSLLHSPPSSRCGSPSSSTTGAAQPLSTASASKYSVIFVVIFGLKEFHITMDSGPIIFLYVNK